MATVQETILRLRRFGLSQSEIGRAVGIPQPRISRWEAGDVPEPVDDALRLVDLLERVERERRGEEKQPPSKHRPLAMSGRGAMPECQTNDQESTAAQAAIAVQNPAGARKTAASEGVCHG